MTEPAFDYEQALKACARGERGVFKQLYDREAKWLLGVAMRIVQDRPLAEEVLQESFVQIWTKAQQFDPTLGSARGWIYTIVRNRSLSEVRRPGYVRRVDVSDIEQVADLQAGVSSAGRIGDQDQATTIALDKCLEQLDGERRACIEAAYLNGYTQAELAIRFDKPLGTIKSWIRRGLLTLRECLK